MKKNFYARSLLFAQSFSLWSGLIVSALGAMDADGFFALVESGSITEIEMAIQDGQNLEQENIWGWTPLLYFFTQDFVNNP